MNNTNYLKNIRCPDCGNEGRFLIAVTVWANLTDDAAAVADGQGRFGWNDDVKTRCPGCSKEGRLAEFDLEDEELTHNTDKCSSGEVRDCISDETVEQRIPHTDTRDRNTPRKDKAMAKATKAKQANVKKHLPKHSPGPWTLEKHRRLYSGSFLIRAADRRAVGSTSVWDIDWFRLNEANARLMAAAPDLLDTLTKSEAFIRGFDGDELQEGVGELLAEIRAAIAQANGRAA